MVSIAVGQDILLRSYLPGDEAELFRAVNESRMHLSPWLKWVNETTREEHSLQFIEYSIHKLEAQEELALGIWFNEKLIGGLGMYKWDHNTKRAQLGYWIVNDFEGKGIITSCLSGLIDFLFNKTGLNKLEIRFVAANKRSTKVAERLGFKIEGIIRQSYIRNGLLEDMVVTGLLKEEWRWGKAR